MIYTRDLTEKEFNWQLADYKRLTKIRRTMGGVKFLGNIDMFNIGRIIDTLDTTLFGRLKILSTGKLSFPNY